MIWWAGGAYISSPGSLQVLPADMSSQRHTSQYPTLSRIDWDYLAIQGSATPSEWAFSSGGLMATAHRNKLSIQMFESLQLLKSAYRNGHIAAVDQVQSRRDFGAFWDDEHDPNMTDASVEV